MPYTKYAFLSDKELLAHCQALRRQSPIIEALCVLVEAGTAEETSIYDIEEVHRCPVCEAQLAITCTETEPGDTTDNFNIRADEV